MIFPNEITCRVWHVIRHNAELQDTVFRIVQSASNPHRLAAYANRLNTEPTLVECVGELLEQHFDKCRPCIGGIWDGLISVGWVDIDWLFLAGAFIVLRRELTCVH